MPTAFTSRTALAALLPKLGGLQRQVYDAIANWPEGQPGPSIEDLANQLHKKESSICGRINELRESGAIEDAPMKVNASGTEAKTYRALAYKAYNPPVQPQPQLDFFSGTLAANVSPYQTRV